MTRPGLSLGPFDLVAPIGHGAMGEVWSGIHAAQGTPVAVKILNADFATEPQWRAAFRREVQAVAGLHHPGVVHVLDCGEVEAGAAHDAGDPALFNRPYLVMELASGGSLDKAPLPLPWPELRRVTLALLDALAHAHARGVIHRDIKPANVLIATDRDARPGLKLSDFGIAHALERGAGAPETMHSSAGTPQYMAPEQFRGQWHEQGPWTDLYALGCMLFELTTGSLPFVGRSFLKLAQAHLGREVPVLSSPTPMPDGLGEWLMRMLEKTPSRRFRRAADAAWAFVQLVDPKPGPSQPPTGRSAQTTSESETRVGWTLGLDPDKQSADRVVEINLPEAVTATQNTAETFIQTLALSSEPGPAISQALERLLRDPRPAPSAPDVPPLPDTWRRAELRGLGSDRLLGAGLGLYGLRSVPFIGRDRERDALWEALQEVGREGEPRVVLVSGASGVGKSRLVEWICQRAHEVGAATIMRAFHSPTPSVGDGLPRMLLRHLRCVGMPGPSVLSQVIEASRHLGILDPSMWRAIAAFIAPEGDLVSGGQKAQAHRWRGPLRGIIEGEARRRPVILWLDDVQWGGEALGFAAHMLEASAEVPVLMVLTARTDVTDLSAEREAQITHLAQRASGRALELAPMSREEGEALARELLVLEGGLATRISERSEGNPLFAVQLVGDWVQRGVLEVGGEGWQLRAGERAQVPDDIHELWMSRVMGLEKARIEALEIAAVLGHEIHIGEWEKVCDRASLGVSLDGLVSVLVGRRLALRTEQGWRFVHGMLREALERQAEEAGRLGDHHARCVAVLTPWRGLRRGVAARLGRHLEALGDVDAAIEMTLEAAQESIRAADYSSVERNLHSLDGLWTRLGQSEDTPDPRRGEALRVEILLRRLQGRLDEAEALARTAAQAAREAGWRRPWALALLLQAQVRFERWEPEGTIEMLESALEALEAEDDFEGTVDALIILAHIHMRQGALEQAEALYGQARRLSQKTGDAFRTVECVHGLGFVFKHRGDLEMAESLHQEALEGFEHFGNLLGAASCVNNLAEVARFRGELDRAEAGYRRALGLHKMIGSGAVIYPRLNLGLVLLHRESYAEARTIFTECLEQALAEGRSGLLAGVKANMLPCVAFERDWTAWDAQVPEMLRSLSDAGLVDPDIAWPLERAAQLALDAGESARAVPVMAAARAQWRALGRVNPDQS